MKLPRRPWSPLAVLARSACLTFSVFAAACSESPSGPGSPSPDGPPDVARALRVRADNPTLLPGDSTPLRATSADTGLRRAVPVEWRALDGGTIQAVTLQGQRTSVFAASEPGTYRVTGTGASPGMVDTTLITVASPAVSATITSLEVWPTQATIGTRDTLRVQAWGRTAKGDSVPASVTLSAPRGFIRGMDYACSAPGTYGVEAQLRENAGIHAGVQVTVRDDGALADSTGAPCPVPDPTAPDSVPAPAPTPGAAAPARIILKPATDTVPVSDTVRFTVYGRTVTGDSVAVAVTLSASSGRISGMQWYAPSSGCTCRIRAVLSGSTLADTSWITVKAPAVAAPAPAPAPDTTQAPVPAPAPTPTPTVSVELPRSQVDTRTVAPTGRTISVPAGGDLQAALNAAARGDVVELAAGARFTGNFVLPPKSGTGWITIRSSGTLPPEGVRVTPASATGFAKIVTANSMPAIYTSTSSSTSGYRLVGLELTSSAAMTYAVVNLGDYSRTAASVSELPSAIILDRVYVHGTSSMDLQRCVTLNSRASAVINSWLSDCHYRNTDAQAIAGWTGPGPYTIENNHLEGATENIMFGGSDPSFTGLVPSDIIIRRNHITKPLAWKGVWVVKNLLELKNAQRVLVEQNVFENNWADGQTGFAVVMKSVNQSGACNWCVTSDVTFRGNLITNSPGGFNLSGTETESGGTAVPAHAMLISGNLFQNVAQPTQPGMRVLFQILNGVRDIEIANNTGFSSDKSILFDGAPDTGLKVHDNLWVRGSYGVFGSGRGEGSSAIAYYMPDGTFLGNVIVAAPTSLYPTGNSYPATLDLLGLVDLAGGNLTIGASSPYYTAGTGGATPGLNVTTLLNSLSGVR